MIEAERQSEAVKTQADQTRDRIVSAAREVIARKGKRGATTREIADQAGVNEATLFRHFGNKESLIIAVAKASCPDAKLRDVVSQLHGPIADDLYAIGVAMTEHLESMIDMVRWSLVEIDYENSIFAKEAWRPQTAVRKVIIDYFAARIEAGEIDGNPDDLAAVFMGMILSRTIAREKFPEAPIYNDTDYAIRLFVNVFLNGVRSK
ncbi:MAG: TetR/AcrR family transcriptional regulator [Candidatus Eremiobacteraeota bacterium]|nr:TetR/AcrR family transcriptional regulator [Candidatus Eremiobacteraeota bacterium]